MINESSGHLPALCISLNSNAHKQFFVINIFPFVTCTFAAVVSDIHIAGVGQSVYPLSPRAWTTAGQTCVMRSSSPHAGVTYSVTRTSALPRALSIFTQLIKVLFSLFRILFSDIRERVSRRQTHTTRCEHIYQTRINAMHFISCMINYYCMN